MPEHCTTSIVADRTGDEVTFTLTSGGLSATFTQDQLGGGYAALLGLFEVLVRDAKRAATR